MRILLVLLFLSSNCLAQSTILGKWTTVDDESGKARSIVEIVERSSKVSGKVIKLYPSPDEDPDPICDKCPDDDIRHNQKIIGLEIIRDMIWSETELTDGTILDPESGKIYQCKIWLEGQDLKVRGYWGPFFRTQTWKKVH